MVAELVVIIPVQSGMGCGKKPRRPNGRSTPHGLDHRSKFVSEVFQVIQRQDNRVEYDVSPVCDVHRLCMKKSPDKLSCVDMMRVRGSAPSNEDEKGYSVRALTESAPNEIGEDLTIKVRLRNLMTNTIAYLQR